MQIRSKASARRSNRQDNVFNRTSICSVRREAAPPLKIPVRQEMKARMPAKKIMANYYQQFPADYSLEVPGEGYGGWKRAEIDLDLDRTTLAVMHAWDPGTMETNLANYHSHEYLPRASEILRTVFPVLLSAVRSSPMQLFHVVERGGKYYQNHPNYLATVELAGPSPSQEQLPPDRSLTEWRENLSAAIRPMNEPRLARNFAPEALPQGAEPIAKDSHQLFTLCKKHNVNHLIYIGFALNACLLISPGGMLDMFRRRILCSTIRQATTAVENKESARHQLHKEEALWRVGLDFGFVFDLEDFLDALRRRNRR